MSDIQQLFIDHGPSYLRTYGDAVPSMHRKAIRAIRQCRTGACGHHLFTCGDCGTHQVAKSSCGNRHCPLCQHDKGAMWVYKQQMRLLPCTYFFATFTMPEGLRAVARSHQRSVYKALFDCAAEALSTLEADRRFVGCKVSGFFGVLHTWTRQLAYHPHVHFIIPGGGLSADRSRWVAARGDFLVHVKALSRLFRGKMKAALKQAGLLEGVPSAVWTQEWVVHCKAAGDGRHCLKYLGAYVFRVAISDARIESYDGKAVTFKYQKVGSSRWRRMTLDAFEFIRRYLQHVLPHGFMKVRHYGFCSHNFSIPIQRIRELICVLYETLREMLPALTPPKKKKPLRCPCCKKPMHWLHFIPPGRRLPVPI